MDDNNLLENINFIFKDIFGIDNPFSPEQLLQKFCFDIPLPKLEKCSMTGADTWVDSLDKHSKIIDGDTVRTKLGIADWTKPKKPINSMDDLFSYWNELNIQRGNKVRGSVNVQKSDSIMDSSNVYMSTLIGNGKNIFFSYNNFNCSYMLATRGNNSCSLGIRMLESVYCSSGFEVNYCNKVSKSMFTTDCFDLYECMFCFQLSSKKYCICNMQFEQEEYMKIKAMVVEWIIQNYGIKA